MACDKFGNGKLKKKSKDKDYSIFEDWKQVAQYIMEIFSHFGAVNLNKWYPKNNFDFKHTFLYEYVELSLFVRGLLNSFLKK